MVIQRLFNYGILFKNIPNLVGHNRLIVVATATPITDGYKANGTVALRRLNESLKLTVRHADT